MSNQSHEQQTHEHTETHTERHVEPDGTEQQEDHRESSEGGQVSEAGSSFGNAETDLNGADAVPDKTTGPGLSNQEG